MVIRKIPGDILAMASTVMPNSYAPIPVRDSAIEEESVGALGIFCHAVPFPKFALVVGRESADVGRFREPFSLHHDRWKKGPFAYVQTLGGEAEIVKLLEDAVSVYCSRSR